MNNSKLTPKVQKNLMLAVAVLWALCTAAWIVTLVLDVYKDASLMQGVFHGICTVLSAACAALNFRRWRAMPAEQPVEQPAEDALDSADE